MQQYIEKTDFIWRTNIFSINCCRWMARIRNSLIVPFFLNQRTPKPCKENVSAIFDRNERIEVSFPPRQKVIGCETWVKDFLGIKRFIGGRFIPIPHLPQISQPFISRLRGESWNCRPQGKLFVAYEAHHNNWIKC